MLLIFTQTIITKIPKKAVSRCAKITYYPVNLFFAFFIKSLAIIVKTITIINQEANNNISERLMINISTYYIYMP